MPDIPINLFFKIGEWLKTWVRRPSGEIKFVQVNGNEENEYCHTRRLAEKNKLARFYRLGVNNRGKEKISSANIRVEKVYEYKNNEWVEVTTSPFQLHWANDQSNNSRNIFNETPEYIDLVYVVENEAILNLYLKSHHIEAGVQWKYPRGKYKLLIKLLGENIKPFSKEVFITFESDWNELEIRVFDH